MSASGVLPPSGLTRRNRLELLAVAVLLGASLAVYVRQPEVWRSRTTRHYVGAVRDAVLRGEAGTVRRFIDDGSFDPDARTDVGRTLLMDATAAGHREVVALLLGHAADLEARARDSGESALSIAMAANRVDIVKLLLDHGADVDRVDRAGDNVLLAAVRHGLNEVVGWVLPKTANLDRKDARGYTALMLAAEQGNVSVVRLLLNQDVSVLETSHAGDSALSLAVKGGYLDVVRALLEAGATVRDELEYAATAYDTAIVKLLLERGVPLSREGARRLVRNAERLEDREMLALLARYGITSGFS